MTLDARSTSRGHDGIWKGANLSDFAGLNQTLYIAVVVALKNYSRTNGTGIIFKCAQSMARRRFRAKRGLDALHSAVGAQGLPLRAERDLDAQLVNMHDL